MSDSQLAAEFMRGAIGGVSKAQLIRIFKNRYNVNDQEIDQIINLCRFKRKPKQIDYGTFYNCVIKEKAEQIYYPFTQVYIKKDFLRAEECNKLMEIIDRNLRPSTVSDPKDSCTVSDYRTSKTADLNYFSDPFYLEIDRRIAALMEFNPFLGETMQAQRYEPGQYYKEHWDFFSPTSPEYKVYCEWMGQRTWTTMIYLNDVEEGGETYFKHLKLRIKPQRGLLLAWNNLYKTGLPNFKTMHEACPPVSGNKYVITKWWRSWTLI